MNDPSITIILPTRNEEGGIREIVESLRFLNYEILIVDGQSTDRTRDIAKELGLKVVLDGGRGKGDGLRTGIRTARSDILVFMDADGSHEPKDIPPMIRPILEDKADLVIGSRPAGGSDEFKMDLENLVRQVGSDIATTLINLRWKVDLTDTQNGFRAIRGNVAREIKLKANDFDIEEEMVMKALKKGYRVCQIPSHEYNRKWGQSKLPTSKCWIMLYRLIKELITP